MDSSDLNDRHTELQTCIVAARRRLAENSKMEWAEIGNMLEGLSLELEDAHKADEQSRHSLYERIEGELNAIHARLDPNRPGA